MYPLLAQPHRIKLQPDFATVYVVRDDLSGQIQVNETGAAILCLCNGSKTEAEIIKDLAEKYTEQEEKVAEFVKEFLVRSSQLGTITWIADPSPISIRVTGSRDYWTPDSVVIELTYNCPLSCQHCFLGAGSGPSEVQVATCVTKRSVGEVEALSGYLKDLGVRTHRIGVVTERGRAAKNGLDASVELRAQVRELRTRLREKSATSSFTISGFEDDVPEAHRAKYCGAGCKTLKVSPDGAIHPCPMITWPIGSIRKNTLKAVLENSSNAFAHLQSPSAALCGECRNTVLCHGCMAEGLLYCQTVPDCSWFKGGGIAEVVKRFGLPES